MTIHAVNYNPELEINPPELDDAEYERNMRNGLRDEICEAISLIDSRLGELDEKGFEGDLYFLGRLREYLRNDMEA